MEVTRQESCRLCAGGDLHSVLDLGSAVPLPKWPAARDDEVPRAPLELTVCGDCGLGQLRHSIDQPSLFRDYWYQTGINATMRDHMATLVAAAIREVGLKLDERVVDIGANDGTLLRSYPPDVDKIGFEPSNLCPSDDSARWVRDFFPQAEICDHLAHRVKVVTTIAMFYYLDDPVGFARHVVRLLRPDGIWICEMNYAVDMVRHVTFDHISHEHVTVWGARDFLRVAAAVGVECFRIERHPLNGGSIRFWCGRPGMRQIEPSVGGVVAQEVEILTPGAYERFASRVHMCSDQLLAELNACAGRSERVYAYGASTRGNTILSAARIDGHLVQAAIERNGAKVGRFYGPYRIPILGETAMTIQPPDAVLILPYSFAPEFRRREKRFLDAGGRFLFPVPGVASGTCEWGPSC